MLQFNIFLTEELISIHPISLKRIEIRIGEDLAYYIMLDVETKNLGSRIMEDNELLLSLQLGDAAKQELYYADSKDPQLALEIGKKRIASLLSQGVIFAGYNLNGFDTVMLRKFLGIEIPESRVLDLLQSPRLKRLTSGKKTRLEEVCRLCGIEAGHKPKMDKRAEKYKAQPHIMERARAEAEDIIKNKGWSSDFAFSYTLDKIAGGHAIWDAYLEFVESGGRKNTLFYEYAIGDIISEYQLLSKLGY